MAVSFDQNILLLNYNQAVTTIHEDVPDTCIGLISHACKNTKKTLLKQLGPLANLIVFAYVSMHNAETVK